MVSGRIRRLFGGVVEDAMNGMMIGGVIGGICFGLIGCKLRVERGHQEITTTQNTPLPKSQKGVT